ncbi:DUF6177 family protein [Actinomadura atramentaria]|uniref:DUF6177 family protein n=1 Tax=Actinomadura atramentaria TaxID=1990 RepID=UPI000399F727|nr:DUF6177 family protein [Actinomadura atramentaria]
MSTVDALTGQAMVVLQDRPLVALSAWISGALRDCEESGRTLQLVTPLETRLSLPLRSVTAGAAAQWVVRHNDGFYEGLSGRPLQWNGSTFVPVPQARDYAPGFTTAPAAPVGAQLGLTYRVRHDAEGLLGAAVDRLLQLLTGKWPAGWGPAEPLENPWQPDRVTEYARGRSTARIIVGGDGPRPAQAVCDFSTAGGGAVEESTTVTVGYAPQDPPPLQHLGSLIAAMAADQPLTSMSVQLTPGRADLTSEPRWMGAAAPVAMAVAGNVAGPAGIPAQQVGPARAPMTLFTVGDGRSADGWQRHQALVRHLQAAGYGHA